MIEEKEFKGYWWLLENPEKRVGGIATFSPDNIKLETFSELKIREKDFGPKIILGFTTEGKKITLRHCQKKGFKITGKMTGNEEVATPEIYFAEEIFVGEHFEREEIYLDSIEASFPLLQEWMKITGVNYSGSIMDDLPKKISPEDNFNIDYKFPESITSEIQDGLLELKIRSNIKPKRTGGAKIDENAIVKISPKKEKFTFGEGIEYIYTFQDFLRLATRKILTPLWIKGKIEKSEEEKPKEIDIYFPLEGETNIPQHLHPNRVNFMFDNISDQFDSTMNKWYQKAEELKPLYHLYFEIFHNPYLYPRNRFLSLIQALEAYYQVEHDGEYLPLKNKLKTILEEYESIFSKLPLDIKSKIDGLVDTRNYLVHHDENIDNVNTDRLPEYSWMLRSIIETVLLKEIDIPEEQIVERLSQALS